MAAQAISMPKSAAELKLTPFGGYPELRILAWDKNSLYASRGYMLLRADLGHANPRWTEIAACHPAWWRKLTSKTALPSRLLRDGFHALAVLPSGHIIGAVPGQINTLAPQASYFRVTHTLLRGTRPLHITSTPDGRVYWGEYFDNPNRDEVHIYASSDCGATWSIAYTFPRGAIRHVHNIVFDEWRRCLWILTGDNGHECRILRASLDLRTVDVVLAGNQQARAVALVPTHDGVYFSTDTPLDTNHIYKLDSAGNVTPVASLPGSSIYGCRVGDSVFFSTMVEPSPVNSDRCARIFGSADGLQWPSLLNWQKDFWSMKYFQYGNAILPDGLNTTNYLALTTVATTSDDLVTTIYQVESAC
jgi:hypothetical protein